MDSTPEDLIITCPHVILISNGNIITNSFYDESVFGAAAEEICTIFALCFECMSTRSSSTDLFPPSRDPERIIRRRNRGEPSLLLDLEEINMNPNNNQNPPPVGPIPQNHGVGDAIVVLAVLERQFELKVRLLNLVTAILFQGAAQTWLEKEPPNSITTWDDLVSKFMNQFFPPSRTTNLRNDITNFQQKYSETFNSLNFAVGGNLLTRNTQEALTIIENKSKVQSSRNKSQVFSSIGSSSQNDAITALTKQVKALVASLKEMYMLLGETIMREGVLPNNTIPNPWEDIKVITTQSSIALARPSVPPPNPSSSSSKEVERDPEPTMDQMLKDLLTNNEKLLELANTPLNDNCSAVLLKKLLEKLGDPRKFLIPCDFSELEECMALANVELANHLVAYPAGIAKDVFVQVEIILRMARALVDVYREELTLKVGDEKLIFNVESTSKYPYKHRDESINQIDIIDTTCEDHFHEVLNVHKLIHPLSGSPTPSSDPVVASLSPSLTPFEDNILFLEKLLNDDLIKDLPPKELKNDETKMTKSLIDEPPDLKLKDLPSHLKYALLKGTSKLPVIIAKNLREEEKDQLIKVLKSHKQAIAWKISDIKGIDPNFCIHKILMKDDFKPAVQH
ncbi:reverse transcriptase domain-containing protein [Tanacetum coccineum]|uniref:Reverse transcriptase domain-containing protein n=1 Tax=Tanacetum coccineum TaxID=301880 RepID=A0ABQ4WHA4_9ASTR